MKGRAKSRGKPLDANCKKAIISKYEYGSDDTRCFCHGLYAEICDYEIREECLKCGAYVGNAKPL